MVIRTDDNGVTSLVKDGLSFEDANKLVIDLSRRGHKQTYEVLWYRFRHERENLIRLRGIYTG